MTLSVIIPVYNVEKYVEECLRSVILQNKQYIEIIVVDDGSLDNSYQICAKIKSLYKDIEIQLIRQPNQGLSVARNTGLAHAKGEYVLFLDSDDMLSENAIDYLVDCIEEKPDMILFDAAIKNEIGIGISEEKYSRIKTVESIMIQGTKYFCDFYFSPLIVSACLCMFRKSFLEEKHLCFTPGRLHEDISFSLKTVLYAEKIKYIPYKLYIRRYRADSITTVNVSEKHILDQIYAYCECIHFAIQKKYADIKITNSLVYYFCNVFLYLMRQNKFDVVMNIMPSWFEKVLEFFNSIPFSQRGYTYFTCLEKIVGCASNYQLIKTDTVIDKWLKENKTSIKNLLDQIIAKKEKFWKEVLFCLPFNTEKRIGIYGTGKHTEELLNNYEKIYGKITADIIFLESNAEDIVKRFRDTEVYSIRDVFQKGVDVIVISSYKYHAEMKKECRQILNGEYQNVIELIDLYDYEKTPIF